MKVHHRFIDSVALVAVEGDVDMYSSPDLRQTLQRLTSDRVKVIAVDLSAVDFMDSSGIATLVQALKEARPYGGEIRLARPGGNVMRVLKLSNLTSLFPVFETVDEACAE
jgi:anti-sigma B factor antagonist